MQVNPYYKSQADCDSHEWIMERYFRYIRDMGLTDARTKEEFYGFEVSQILMVHEHKQGFGSGVFFRLISGSVVDAAANRHESDETLYDQTTH